MGAAAYRRGSRVIARQIARDFPVRDASLEIMDRINAMPKKPLREDSWHRGARRRPLLDKYAIQYDPARNVWWMMDPDNMYEGYSRFYPTLQDAIMSWDDLYLTGYDYGTHTWTAEVISQNS